MQSVYTFDKLKNFQFEMDYYPTDPWEWLRVYIGDLLSLFSSSYDKSNNFGLTNLGYSKWVNIIITYVDGVLTISSGSKTASKNVVLTAPLELKYYVNKNGNSVRNVKLKKL
ncbi:MAG: hypothetical protein J6M91_07320 [Methanobrevibacter sp.]|nr:hypothetical protein [Methanobrevibacter sp.]